MNGQPLTRAVLDRTPCSTPGCSHGTCAVFLVARCHPHAAVDARYDKTSGLLTIRCHRCKEFVAELAIAEKP